MTTYTIEYQDRRTGQIESECLRDDITEAEALVVVSAAAEEESTYSITRGVYLAFFREEDGQYGYINPGGAAAVGEDWV